MLMYHVQKEIAMDCLNDVIISHTSFCILDGGVVLRETIHMAATWGSGLSAAATEGISELDKGRIANCIGFVHYIDKMPVSTLYPALTHG